MQKIRVNDDSLTGTPVAQFTAETHCYRSSKMTIIRRLLILAFLDCLLTGCAPAAEQFEHSLFNSRARLRASRVAVTCNSETASVQVTLPLLDALLTDEKFVAPVETEPETLRPADRFAQARLRVPKWRGFAKATPKTLDGNATDARTRAVGTVTHDARRRESARTDDTRKRILVQRRYRQKRQATKQLSKC